jgi:general secretion pathway protein D
VSTSVVVASGDSIVLGGLIREDGGNSSTGVPLLSKIPILGAAFGSQSYSKRRTELVLIITPRVVSDNKQALEVTEELRRKLPALEKLLPEWGATQHGSDPGRSGAKPSGASK